MFFRIVPAKSHCSASRSPCTSSYEIVPRSKFFVHFFFSLSSVFYFSFYFSLAFTFFDYLLIIISSVFILPAFAPWLIFSSPVLVVQTTRILLKKSSYLLFLESQRSIFFLSCCRIMHLSLDPIFLD